MITTKPDTKRVEWSYPTSPNADRFGFKDGCYCVEIVNGTTLMPKAVAGFATIEQARENAAKVPLGWDRFTK